MLETQSLEVFLNNINSGKVVIVSLSPQLRASIAIHFGISPIQKHLVDDEKTKLSLPIIALACPEEVYRVTVMPCYDKKLEAARNDFASLFGYQVEGHESEINMISEVDLVLRTGEVLELIQCGAFRLININEEGYIYGVHRSFGVYAETIFRCAAKKHFGRQIDDYLTFRNIRNSDFLTLEASSCELYNISFMLVRKVAISIYCMNI
ncbi:hypothetical protein JHK82_043566 [Glycine max]|nr:hypothetical protein JHK82_043566 [Glycine max]